MQTSIVSKFEGNFFNNRDVKFAKALNDSLLDIAVVGATRVKDQLYRGHGLQTGYLRASVHGGLVKNFHAQIDAGQLEKGRNVEYANWVEGVSAKNHVSRFKGYKMFYKTFQYLKRVPKEVKDIMEFHIRKNLN